MSPVEQIKERLSLVDVVSQYVKLTKAGKHHKGLSPFTKEKTPSFYVSPDRGLYHCFSTGKGGDIFTFVEEMEGVDFQGALKILAERAGVELKYESQSLRDKRSRLYAVLKDAKLFYQDVLSKESGVLKYLNSRGINEKSIKNFELGYAPDNWDSLTKKLTGLGYTKEELEKSGLSKSREGKDSQYDIFRNRIVFPINDASRRTVGFSGRIFPDREKKDREGAKYLNTPETELFIKSRILYGYDKAKQSIRKHNFSILVEGQMDVVMSHQAGYTNTVAVSGTAFSEYHLNLLKRLSKNLLMAFDADDAGIASSGKSAALALLNRMDVKVSKLEEGIDPADLIKKNPEDWKKAIRNSTHIVEFYLDVIESKEKDLRKRGLKAHELIIPLLAQIENRIDQAHFISLVASRLKSPEDVIWDEVKKIKYESVVSEETKPQITEESRENQIIKELLGILLWQKNSKERCVDCDKFEKELKRTIGDNIVNYSLKNPDKHNELIFLAEVIYNSRKDIENDIVELFNEFKKYSVKRELIEITKSLQEAEKAGDNDKIKKLFNRSMKLSKRLASFE